MCAEQQGEATNGKPKLPTPESVTGTATAIANSPDDRNTAAGIALVILIVAL
jgi:hypothetical protein